MKKSIKNFIIITAVAMSAFAFGPTFAMESNKKTTSPNQIFQEQLRNELFDLANYLIKSEIAKQTSNENSSIDPLEYPKKELANLKNILEHYKNSCPENTDKISEYEMIKSELSDLIERTEQLTKDIYKENKTLEEIMAEANNLKATAEKLKTKNKKNP